MHKHYMSRSQTRSMSSDYPIGDPTGGAAYGEFNDPLSAAISVGGSLLGGAMGAKGAKDAANTQAAAGRYAADLQKQQFDITNQQQAAGRGLGYQGYNQIRGMLPGQYTQYDEQGNAIGTATGNDYLTRQFTAQDFQQNIDPSYAFRLHQGQLANQAAANKAGGLLSGNALQGLNEYNQNMASTEYGNAFNRFQTQRGNIYNTLASIAGLGQTAQGQTNQAAQNFANTQTGLVTGVGAAQAAGQIGAANAYGNAAANIGNAVSFNQMMNNRPANRPSPYVNTYGASSGYAPTSGSFGYDAAAGQI